MCVSVCMCVLLFNFFAASNGQVAKLHAAKVLFALQPQPEDSQAQQLPYKARPATRFGCMLEGCNRGREVGSAGQLNLKYLRQMKVLGGSECGCFE